MKVLVTGAGGFVGRNLCSELKNNGKFPIIVGARPEIIRLAAVINKCRRRRTAASWTGWCGGRTDADLHF